VNREQYADLWAAIDAYAATRSGDAARRIDQAVQNIVNGAVHKALVREANLAKAEIK